MRECEQCKRLRIERDMYKQSAHDWKVSSAYWNECFVTELRRNNLTDARSTTIIDGIKVDLSETQGGSK